MQSQMHALTEPTYIHSCIYTYTYTYIHTHSIHPLTHALSARWCLMSPHFLPRARTFPPLDNFPRTLPPNNSPRQFPLQTRTIPPVPLKTQLENYIYTYMYAHMHTYIYMHIHIDSCTHVYTHTIHTCYKSHTYIHIFMHTYTFIYSHIY